MYLPYRKNQRTVHEHGVSDADEGSSAVNINGGMSVNKHAKP